MNNREKHLQHWITAVRVLFASFLIFISLPGIQGPFEYLGWIYGLRLFGRQVGLSVAVIAPWIGIVLAACLVSGACVQGALLGGMVFLTFWMYGEIRTSAMNVTWLCGGLLLVLALLTFVYTLVRADGAREGADDPAPRCM